MVKLKKSERCSLFSYIMAFSLAVVTMPSVIRAQAQVAALDPSNETKPAEVRIVSTEFRFSPATVLVSAGRVVTLVLDNSGAETEHGLSCRRWVFTCKQRPARPPTRIPCSRSPESMNSFAICLVIRKRG